MYHRGPFIAIKEEIKYLPRMCAHLISLVAVTFSVLYYSNVDYREDLMCVCC